MLLALPPAAHAAEVYRCVDKGVITYQDFPCRTPGEGGVVRLVVPDPATPPPPRAKGADDLDETRRNVDVMARERRQREIAAEIDGLERVVARNDKEEAAELDVLRSQRGYAANNFKADGLDLARVDRALTDRMAAVSTKYRERAEPVRRRIVELRNEQKTLTSARQ
ncbi:MAG: DUF4124 domain-containing protein [Casimicrobiaceae bacterium]